MSEDQPQYGAEPMLDITEYDTGVDDVHKLGDCLDRCMDAILGLKCHDLITDDYIFCEKAILQLLADLKARKVQRVDSLDAAVADYKGKDAA